MQWQVMWALRESREVGTCHVLVRGEELGERASGSRLGGRGWGLVAPAQRPKVSKTYASTVGLPGLNLAPRYAISKTKVLEGGTL